jgi:diguanylate cyclase (GGDEF)-like protein
MAAILNDRKLNLMNKSDAKKILEEIQVDIVTKIDSHDGVISKEKLLEFIQSTLNAVSDLDFELPDALDTLKRSLDEQFKDLAQDSISHYNKTNQRFEELVNRQEQTLNDFEDQSIDVNQIKVKFDEIQSHMIEEVSKANTIISDLTKKIDKLEKSTQLDHLTKVYNRKVLSTHLENLCSNNIFTDDIHIFMIDIDNFKIINDTYGHIVGDKVLIFLAHILRKTLREGDKIYRYGGEEFIVILNRIHSNECIKVAQRIVSLVGSNKLIYKELNVNVTVSLGATTLKSDDTPDTLIARADKALYQAKANGKNRIEIDCEYTEK